MRLRHAVASLALIISSAMCGSAAHAQTALYLQGTAQSNDLASSNGYFWGATFGFYQDRHSLGLVHLGYDFRGSIVKHDNAQFSSGLGGARLSIVPHVVPIKVYGEALGGIGVIANGSSGTHFQYQVNGGLEYTLLPHVDWRAIEVAYNGYTGNTGGNPVGLSTGIVIRLF